MFYNVCYDNLQLYDRKVLRWQLLFSINVWNFQNYFMT